MLIRQGDILLVPVDAATRASVRKNGRKVRRVRDLGFVVAEGEATGHHHRVSTKGVKMFERNGVLYLDVPQGKEAELVHDEHETLTVPPGVHRVEHQREYTGPAVQPRRVYD